MTDVMWPCERREGEPEETFKKMTNTPVGAGKEKGKAQDGNTSGRTWKNT